jgi:elongation factor P
MKAKDVRKGNVVIYKGTPHRILDFQHRTPGNLRAFVQIRFRNIINGSQLDDRFSSDDELENADIDTFKSSFLYNDESGYHFMNTETYDQTTLNEETVGEAKLYLSEGLVVEISTFDERPIGIQLPKSVILIIEDCPPEFKGATASGSGKPAKTTSGLAVTVPSFIKIGERVIVDTETGNYLSRAD